MPMGKDGKEMMYHAVVGEKLKKVKKKRKGKKKK